jgi:hypothetical protein
VRSIRQLGKTADSLGLSTPPNPEMTDQLPSDMSVGADLTSVGDYLSGMLFTNPSNDLGTNFDPLAFDWFSS